MGSPTLIRRGGHRIFGRHAVHPGRHSAGTPGPAPLPGRRHANGIAPFRGKAARRLVSARHCEARLHPAHRSLERFLADVEGNAYFARRSIAMPREHVATFIHPKIQIGRQQPQSGIVLDGSIRASRRMRGRHSRQASLALVNRTSATDLRTLSVHRTRKTSTAPDRAIAE